MDTLSLLQEVAVDKETSKKVMRYKKFIDEKSLPSDWQRLYRLEYRRIRSYYKKFMRIDNPVYNIIFEKVAYISIKLRYIESDEFAKNTEVDIEDPLFLKEYNNLISTLNKTMEQVMKYTEVAKKSIKKEELRLSINAQSMTDKELNEHLQQIIDRREVGIPDALARKEITGDQE